MGNVEKHNQGCHDHGHRLLWIVGNVEKIYIAFRFEEDALPSTCSFFSQHHS